MVTLRDIAERLGCTRSTVSYALRNHPHVAPATRAAVQRLARQLGWRPNANLARHMALVRATGNVRELPGMAIVLNKSRAALSEEQTPRLHFEGARARAEELGFHPDVFNLAEQPLSARRLRQVLRARGIKAIVYIATAGTTLPLEHLRIGREFATAMVGVRYPELPYNVAINDFAATGQTAVISVCARGFRRPGAVLPHRLDCMLGWGFTGGIYTGQLDLPAENRLAPLHVGTNEIYVPPSAFASVLAWVDENRPDAILTTDPQHLHACLGALPRAVRPAVFSLDLHAGQAVRGGVDQRQASVGAAGVDLVVGQLHRGERGIPLVQRILLIEGTWQNLGRRLRT